MKFYRAFATVGGMTLVSRIMGFLRDILFAAVLGTGPVAEAFVVAFRLPNLFRRWFGEGAFNAAFVPIFAKRIESDGRDAAHRFANDAFSCLAALLAAISFLAILGMPYLMLVLAPGFAAAEGKLELAVTMSRIAFPYLMCMSLVAMLSGVLNSVGRFWESASVSIVLNLTLIAAMSAVLALGYGNSARSGIVMACGILAAGVLQLLVLIDGARRAGFRPRLVRPRMTDDMRRLVGLGLPGIVAGGITQINIVVGSMIASLQEHAVSWLFYADRLYELPLAMVGIAIGIVLLPEISRHLGAGNEEAARDAQNRSLELALLLTLPAAVALIVIPNEIIAVLFQRAAFTARDTDYVSSALALFALGLPAFVMIKVFSPAFFAREDTRTPMRYAGLSLALNTLGSVGLFFLFRRIGISPHLGIAIATSFGGWLNAGLLYRELRRRGHFVADARLRRAVAMILMSNVALAIVLFAGAIMAAPSLEMSQPLVVRVATLATLIGTGAAVYFAAVYVTGALRLAGLARMLKRAR
ncbi:MAG: murein biosynthesis integral membrane protein MurJ [Hyphomicrobiaceae bacterium]